MTASPKKTDEELILAIRGGDAEAETALYERYKLPVRRRARAFFLMGADREDVIQEGMIGLYKAVCGYEPEKGVPFRVFAELCVTRQIISAVRAAAGNKNLPLNNSIPLSTPVDAEHPEVTLFDVLPAADGYDPSRVLIGRETGIRLNDAIEHALAPLEKEVLLEYFDGLSYGQIAEKIGRPEKSVDNALQRVKKKLAACLEEE